MSPAATRTFRWLIGLGGIDANPACNEFTDSFYYRRVAREIAFTVIPPEAGHLTETEVGLGAVVHKHIDKSISVQIP